jgi:peptidyl-prolyl cis-trans isomerase B (cyclophilin B)
MGNIHIELFAKDAPLTVSNFIYLARNNFYDGLTFHRVVPGHVIQGGCPRGDGYGDAGYTIPFEKNEKKHLPGAVGMARSGDDLNSAGSQFYICLARREHLDGKYVVFGQVYEGMDVVEKIGRVPAGEGDRPLESVYIHRVVIYERGMEENSHGG